ncbi:MAG: hypothetical protein HYV09_12725 [Deltaproteobacteria bacterium]|nr:hypothetical protein [Deltaproteobacteria bacterium]
MKKTATSDRHPTPVVRQRLAEMLDALSAECLQLARDTRLVESDETDVADYERVLADIETLAEVLREWEQTQPTRATATTSNCEMWTIADRVKDAAIAKTIASGSRIKAAGPADPCESGVRPTLSLEQARRTIEDLREEDAVRNDVQRALA